MTAQSTLLSTPLQSSSQDYLLLILYLIVALSFFALFYYWWRGVSEGDLKKIKMADAQQTTGPAVWGTEMPQYAQSEAEALADRDTLLASQAEQVAAEILEEADEEEGETAVVQSVAAVAPEPIKPDDLKKIEGIGPKIEQLLNKADIQTYPQLAAADVEQLKQILADAGARYQLADPTTWPAQAKLAAAADWDGLNELQDKLSGGKDVD